MMKKVCSLRYIWGLIAVLSVVGCGSDNGSDHKSNTVMVVSRLEAADDMAYEAKQELLKVVFATRSEPGCLGYDLYQDAQDPSLLVLHEYWEDADAIDYHMSQPYFGEFFAQVDTLFDALDVTTRRSKPASGATPDGLPVFDRMKAAAGQEDAALTVLENLVACARHEAGVGTFDLYQGAADYGADPTVMILRQVWADQAAYDAFLASVCYADFSAAAVGAFEGDRSVSVSGMVSPPGDNRQDIMVVSRVLANGGQEAEARNELISLVSQSREEVGCLAYDLYEDDDDASIFVLHEYWRDADAINTHMGQTYFGDFFAQVGTEEGMVFNPAMDVTTRVSEPYADAEESDTGRTVFERLAAVEGSEDEARAAAEALVDCVRQEGGVLDYELYQGNPNFTGVQADLAKLILREVWADDQDYLDYRDGQCYADFANVTGLFEGDAAVSLTSSVNVPEGMTLGRFVFGF